MPFEVLHLLDVQLVPTSLRRSIRWPRDSPVIIGKMYLYLF